MNHTDRTPASSREGCEGQVLRLLAEKGYTISFAESCTGGLAAARLVDQPSASGVFEESFITYSNEAKIRRLGVSPDTIARFGVVSEEVAAQMASGAAKVAGAQIGVGITGIAGPTGATPGKPIGMVCFGFYRAGKTETATMRFGEIGRRAVREKSVDFVFEYLAKFLLTR